MNHIDNVRTAYSVRLSLLAAALVGITALSPVALASQTVYSNIQSFQNDSVASPLQVWDDVAIVGGGRLESLTLHAFNQGAASGLSAVIDINIFDTLNNRPSGTPVGSVPIDLSQSSFAPGLTPAITVSGLESLAIDLPSDATLAVGMRFPGQAQWAVPFFDPPSVGASQDGFWLGFNPAPMSNPGSVASFGIEFVVVPEPTGLCVMLLLSPWVLRRSAIAV